MNRYVRIRKNNIVKDLRLDNITLGEMEQYASQGYVVEKYFYA